MEVDGRLCVWVKVETFVKNKNENLCVYLCPHFFTMCELLDRARSDALPSEDRSSLSSKCTNSFVSR